MGWPRSPALTSFPTKFVRGLVAQMRSHRVFIWLAAWRIWSFAAAPITLLLLAREVSAAAQGAYYGFLALGAVVTWFELGIGGLMVQGIAYDRARQSLPSGEGRDSPSIQVYRRWYAFAATAYGVVAAGAGLLLLRDSGLPPGWQPCWLLYAGSSAMGFRQTFRIQYIEAMGEIACSYSVRLAGAIGLSISVWIGIAAGEVLWGLGFSGLVQVGIRAWLLASPSRRNPLPAGSPDWRSDYLVWRARILPLQWRTAVAVVCGYVVYQSGGLMALRMIGPEASGELGFALQVASVVAAAGLIPLTAGAVDLSRLGGVADYGRFWRKVRMCAWQSLGFAALGIGSVAAVLSLCRHFGWIPPARIPGIDVLGVAIFCALAGVGTNVCVIAARALQRDPFVPINVAAAVLWLAIVPLLIREWGVTGLLGGMFALQGAAMVAGHAIVLNRLRRRVYV